MKKKHILLAWRMFTIFMMLVLPFGTTSHGVGFNYAQADDLGYHISVTSGPTVDGVTVSIEGESGAHYQTGGNNAQKMSVDWGDGNDWNTTDGGGGSIAGLTFTVTNSGGSGNERWFEGEWTAEKTFDSAGTYNIIISVNNGQPQGQDGSDEAVLEFEVVIPEPDPEADLTIEKTVSDETPTEQDEITYQINIENPASQTSTSTNVIVTDVLPSGVTYSTSTATLGSYDENTGKWTVGDLIPGQGETLTITVTVDDETGETTIDNTAEITSTDVEDPNSENDSSTASITVTTLAICGNGEIETPETCDDGEANGTPNNCNAECTDTTTPVCGNEVIEDGETCDDGEANGTPNQCSNSCDGTTEPICGNDVIEEGETCDDGEDNGTPNNCNNLCTGTTLASCGNEIIEDGETCDDGELNGDPNQCNLDCTGTTTPVCGNEVVESGETCDDGELNGDPNQCNNSCDGTTEPVCGNEVIEDGETCDDGELNGTPNNCSNSCDGITSASCGNGEVEDGETCDDGQDNGTPNNCNLSCDGTTEPVCGNEVIEDGEECDGGETCTEFCTETPGMICGYKYHDSVSENASPDEGEEGLEDWTIKLWSGEACEESETYADEVITFDQGQQKNNDDIDEDRSDSANALGAPDGEFVSLGFAGELVVRFDEVILNQGGDEADFEIIETTNGGLTCNQYPETVLVYASQDGETWVELGETCQDGAFDLGELAWAQYIKLVDVSDPEDFNPTADGFDVDAIQALNCSANVTLVETAETDSEGRYCFETELADGQYRVEEVMQEGWFATDSEYYDVTVDNNTVEVNFFNAQEEPADQGQIIGYKYWEKDDVEGFTEGDEGLENWTIVAESGETVMITSTNSEGEFEFNSLADGIWTVWEIMQSGWKASTSATTSVEIISGAGVSGVNFGNVKTECNDGIDNDDNGLIDSEDPACHTDGDAENEESYDPDIDDEVTYECSDGIDNDEDGLTDENDPACHTDGDPENEQSYDPTLDDESNDPVVDVCANIEGVQETVPEGFVQDGENCVEEEIEEESTPTPPGGGGGGGGGFSSLIIHTERTQGAEDGSITAVITWHTNKPATSRVVWDTQSHDALEESAPNYGYANSTATFDENPKVTFHSVAVPGLDPDTTYYFRPISAASPEVYGVELEFTTSAVEEEPEEETPETPEEEPEEETPGAPTGGGEETGTVAGAETEEEQGTVAGVEFVEEAQAQEVEDSEATTTVEEDETEEEPAAAAVENCLIYIWILLILNLIAVSYAATKSKDAKKSKKNLWWMMALLIVVPTVLAYPQCWLVVWLLITLILSVALVVNLNKKENGQEASS